MFANSRWRTPWCGGLSLMWGGGGRRGALLRTRSNWCQCRMLFRCPCQELASLSKWINDWLMVSKGNHSPIIAYMNVAHPNNHRRSTDYSHSHCSIMSGDYLHEYLLLPLTESRQTFNVRYQLNVSLFTVSVYFHDVAEKNKKCWLIPLVCVTSHADRTTLITQRRVDR